MSVFFEKYSTKMQRINIPLFNFKFFHGISDENNVDPKFLGREKITEQLKSWLINTDIKTGVYLITGFRGMGKSSFVGKVLYDITNTKSNSKPNSKQKKSGTHILLQFAVLSIALFFLPSLLLLINKCSTIFPAPSSINCYFFIALMVIFFLFPAISFSFDIYKNNKKDNKSKIRRIPIYLNLGHENLNESNILSLISRSIEEKYKEYRRNISANKRVIITKTFIISLIAMLLSFFLLEYIIPALIKRFCINTFINSLELTNNWKEALTYILIILTFVCSIAIMYYVWEFCLTIHNKMFDSSSLIAKRLKDLNERIRAEVSEGMNHSAETKNTPFSLNINRQKTKKYPLADAREIELELSNILFKMSRYNFIQAPPEFIIVFDELDKIDPRFNYDIKEDPETLPEFEHVGSGFPGGAASRKRKQTLLRMLANMKFFVSTAQTKFIFIAGREMYDAFLADFSDREFAIGSIFSNVIYVESFLSSSLSDKDITNMTEQFICKQILPPKTDTKKSDQEYYSLKEYHKYLIDEDSGKSKYPDLITENTIHKVITFLHQFSVYLAHISNGAPKKIAIHFEKYIQLLEKNEADLFLPELKKEEKTFYLSFGYRDQQKIGFIHYMAFPLINALINNATQYGDKLLVSACFLTNHIYKYHNNGFSWRNLENIPEILDINKTPELREFIHTIIYFLKQSHLSYTVSGLYNFKFPMKITEEISIMSKFSEEVSALFNFTLDDSLSTKRLYDKSLKYYTKLNKSISNSDKHNDLHHIIAGIHHILGDLNLFDEKYNEAIFEYECCIQALNMNSVEKEDPHSPSHLLYLIRVMMKLALTHEKRKTYNSAYVIYNEIISILIQYRYIDESEFGLKYLQRIKQDNEANSWYTKTDVLYKESNAVAPEQIETVKATDAFKKRIQPKVVTQENYKNLKEKSEEPKQENTGFIYDVEGHKLISRFSRQLTPEKHGLIVRLSMFEDVRLIYQAILAKLFLLEKKGLNGITKESLDIMESEFNYLHRCVNTEEKYIISADFFRKVADIMYYKNGLINKPTADNYFMGWYLWDYNIEDDIHNYCATTNFKSYDTLQKLLNIKYVRKGTYQLNNLNKDEINRIRKFIGEDGKNEYQRNDGLSIEEVGCNIRKVLGKGEDEDEGKNEYKRKGGYVNKFLSVESFQLGDSSITVQVDKNYKKIHECNERRRFLFQDESKYKRIPCYACKYYNRSLKILLSNLLGVDIEETEKSVSKSILILRSIGDKKNMKSLKENDLVVLAYCLDGLGNVLLSCSHKDDIILKDFMTEFLDFVEGKVAKNTKEPKIYNRKSLSHLEKAILYFWSAASFFKFSSNKKEASFCYKKIIQLLVEYVSISNNSDLYEDDKKKERLKVFDKDMLKRVQKLILARAIQNLYSHYENTNMIEIQRIKWTFNKQMFQKIPLSHLSIFPDLEKLVLTYVELELFCPEETRESGYINELYKSSIFTKDRLTNTVSERIVMLRLKAMINMKIVNQLLKYEQHFYNEHFSENFFKELTSYLKNKKSINEALGSFKGAVADNEKSLGNALSTKLDLLEFLIQDTMFCLSKILETISPSIRTTLFTESYIASIYKLLYECNILYELMYMSYKWIELKQSDLNFDKIKEQILSKITKIRAHNTTDNDISSEVDKLLDELKEDRVIKKVIEDGKKEGEKYSETFFYSIYNSIDKSNVHLNISNYLAEMALKKYRRAREIHREGTAYREMIAKIYFLDDGLNNDTCQFYLALERYANNCDVFDKITKKLKDICTNSNLLKIEKYLLDDPQQSASPENNQTSTEQGQIWFS